MFQVFLSNDNNLFQQIYQNWQNLDQKYKLTFYHSKEKKNLIIDFIDEIPLKKKKS